MNKLKISKSVEEKIKILLVEPLGHWAGHPGKYTWSLANALNKYGNADVTIFTFDGLAVYTIQTDNIQIIKAIDSFGPLSHILRIPHRFRKFQSLVPYISLFESIITFAHALYYNKQNSYQIIHFIDGSIIAFLVYAAVVRHKNFVFNINSPKPNTKSSVKEWLKKVLFRLAISKNKINFVCHAEEVLNSYAGHLFYEKLNCIPWGVDEQVEEVTRKEARLRLNLPEEKPVFLLFGINHPFKNFEIVFKALKDLNQDVWLLCVGKIVFPKINNPYRLAQMYGLTNRTIIVDQYVEEKDLPIYFAASDAIILSYKKEFLQASGVLAQACGYKIPVIASASGQIKHFVEKYGLGFTFIPEDASSLREAILKFLNLSLKDKEGIKRNMICFVESHSWKTVATKHMDLYRKFLAEAT